MEYVLLQFGWATYWKRVGTVTKKDKPQDVIAPEQFERDRTLNIHQRVNAIMADWEYVKKNKIIKNKKGEVLFTVTGHDDVTALVHPLLVKHGVNVIPTFKEMRTEVLKVEYYGKDQFVNRERVDAVYRWVNIDKPEDFFEQDWSAYGCDDSDKGPGKAMSYNQRNAILKTLHIETGEKDPEEYTPGYIKQQDEIRRLAAEIEYEKAIEKFEKKGIQQDIPLEDGSQISDGTTLSAELQMQVKKMFITKKMDTNAQKQILDHFMIDSIKEILNSDYENVIKLIKDFK